MEGSPLSLLLFLQPCFASNLRISLSLFFEEEEGLCSHEFWSLAVEATCQKFSFDTQIIALCEPSFHAGKQGERFFGRFSLKKMRTNICKVINDEHANCCILNGFRRQLELAFKLENSVLITLQENLIKQFFRISIVFLKIVPNF